MTVSEAGKLTYSVEEAGRLLGIGRSLAYEAVSRGEIPTIRVGKRLLVPRAAFEKMLAQAGQQRPHEGAASASQRSQGGKHQGEC